MSSDFESAGPQTYNTKNWSNPFQEGTFLGDLFEDVVSEQRDLIIVIDDFFGRRGTGKTVASLQLASAMDQTDEGITWEKCSLSPEEVRNAYRQQPQRSGLVFDEGEVGASNRNPMSNTNRALREIMSMGRVEQKYLVVNAPVRGFIDKDILKLADVWISMVRRGAGVAHWLKWETYSNNLLNQREQWIEFDDIPTGTELRRIYNRLTKEKRDRMDGEESNFIPASEHKKKVKKETKKQAKKTRNKVIRSLWNHPEVQESNDISQRVIGEATGINQSRVSQILRGDGQ